MFTGYIYLITNLENGKKYVGQTMRTVEKRFNQHKFDAKHKKCNSYLHRAMNKYGEENFIVRELYSIITDTKEELLEDLNFFEIFFIDKYNTLAPNGYNLTKGGDNVAASMKRMVDEYDLDGNFIQTHESLGTAANVIGGANQSSIWNCCKGKSLYAHQRIWRYHGDSLDKYPMPNKHIAEHLYQKIPIDQYSMEGKFLRIFDSIQDAARFLRIQNSSHIISCCKGKAFYAYGYVWRYHGEAFDKYPLESKQRLKCNKYDLDGNLLDTYSSLSEACLSLGKDPKNTVSTLSKCCRGKIEKAYGYKWSYA